MSTWKEFQFVGENVELSEAPSADHTGSGSYIVDTVGETVAIGDVLYMKADGKWWKADADAAASMPGSGLAMTCWYG